jgi:hypothetical protein
MELVRWMDGWLVSLYITLKNKFNLNLYKGLRFYKTATTTNITRLFDKPILKSVSSD